MAYKKQEFKKGQTLTAKHMNHIEDGLVENLIVTVKLNNSIAEFKNETGNIIFSLDLSALNTGGGSGGSTGGGLNTTASALLINILRNALYNTDQSSNITLLQNELNGESGGDSGGDSGGTTTYAVINNLTNVTTSNKSTSVTANGSYSATLTVNDGCTLGSVTVTMGGADITSTAYANGKVTIGAVTGLLIITAVATSSSSGGGGAYIQDGLEHEFTSLSAKKTISGGQSIFNSGADFTVFVAHKKTDTMTNYAHKWIGDGGTSDNLEFFFRRNWDNKISLTAAEVEDASLSGDNNKTWACPSGVDVDGMLYVWVVKNGGTVTAFCNDIRIGTISQANAKIFEGNLVINASNYPTPKLLIYSRALSADECTQTYEAMRAEVGE